MRSRKCEQYVRRRRKKKKKVRTHFIPTQRYAQNVAHQANNASDEREPGFLQCTVHTSFSSSLLSCFIDQSSKLIAFHTCSCASWCVAHFNEAIAHVLCFCSLLSSHACLHVLFAPSVATHTCLGDETHATDVPRHSAQLLMLCIALLCICWICMTMLHTLASCVCASQHRIGSHRIVAGIEPLRRCAHTHGSAARGVCSTLL